MRSPSRKNVSKGQAVLAATGLAVLAAMLAVVPQQATAQGHFSDTSNHFAHDSINYLMDNGVLGDSWSTWCGPSEFCPSNGMARWMGAVWLVRAIDRRDPQPVSESSFSDVNPNDFWAPYIERLREVGLTEGYPDGTFRPHQAILRRHIATFLERTPADLSIRRASYIALHSCSNGSTHCPNERVTRGESAEVLAAGLRGDLAGDTLTPPEGNFKDVSSGNFHSCALRSTDHTAVCWGLGLHGQTNAPEGQFHDIDAGAAHTCATRRGGPDDQKVVCWGANTHGQSSPPADKRFFNISAGEKATCGIWNADGGEISSHHWNKYHSRRSSDADRLIWAHTPSAWNTDRTLVCWGAAHVARATGWDDYGTKLRHTFEYLDVGQNHMCALIWGSPNSGSIQHGWGHPFCWGWSENRLIIPGHERTKQRYWRVSSSNGFSCAVHRADYDVPNDRKQKISCWGRNEYGIHDTPDAKMLEVATGWWHACGIRKDDRRVECWGRNNAGQTNVGQGTRVFDNHYWAISAGGIHTCAIQTYRDRLVCWGFLV